MDCRAWRVPLRGADSETLSFMELALNHEYSSLMPPSSFSRKLDRVLRLRPKVPNREGLLADLEPLATPPMQKNRVVRRKQAAVAQTNP